MDRKFSPMYCRKDAIAGMHEEKRRAEHLLDKLKDKAGIALLAVDNSDWVYGQATFAYQDGQPFKFFDRFSTLVSNQVLDVLVQAGNPSAILFVDASLKAKFESHHSFLRVKHLFRQVTEFTSDHSSAGFFKRVKRFFTGTVDSEPLEDEAKACRFGVKVHAERLMRETDLSELLLSIFALYHYCSLDKAQEALEARVRDNPTDALAHTGLALLLSHYGDHPAAFAQSKVAINLPTFPPEALLCHAMEAWWANETTEGQRSLAQIQSAPAHWPRAARRGLETVGAALLAQEGKHTESVQYLERAIEIDGSSYALHLCLAHQLQVLGRIEEAQSAVDNASVIRTYP